MLPAVCMCHFKLIVLCCASRWVWDSLILRVPAEELRERASLTGRNVEPRGE